jgi:hypothetical protein
MRRKAIEEKLKFTLQTHQKPCALHHVPADSSRGVLFEYSHRYQLR